MPEPVTTQIGRVSTANPPVGTFPVTNIRKTSVDVINGIHWATFAWDAPAEVDNHFTVELYRVDGSGDHLENAGNTSTVSRAIQLSLPEAGRYKLKITSFKDGGSSYVIIEEIEKLW